MNNFTPKVEGDNRKVIFDLDKGNINNNEGPTKRVVSPVGKFSDKIRKKTSENKLVDARQIRQEEDKSK